MKVLTCSQYFPKGHPRAGEATFFVEKALKSLGLTLRTLPDNLLSLVNDFAMMDDELKYHTIRAGNRFNPGDMASLRVWSDKPYRSKQIEFAQIEVKKVYRILKEGHLWWVDNQPAVTGTLLNIAHNDGLGLGDFIAWFASHPKKVGPVFSGQIICWADHIDYTGKPASLENNLIPHHQ